MSGNNPEVVIDGSTLHEVFQPTEQVLDFILQAATVLAEKYDRHPSEFAVKLGIDANGKLSGNNYIEYDGTESPEITAGDTIIINDHYHTADDHGDSSEIRVPIPRSF